MFTNEYIHICFHGYAWKIHEQMISICIIKGTLFGKTKINQILYSNIVNGCLILYSSQKLQKTSKSQE
jgi:hypothetical protein